jgi:carbamate kinase
MLSRNPEKTKAPGKLSRSRTAVIALGGNAIIKEGQEGNIYQQFANTRESLAGIVELIRLGYNIIITHGNGPQVGNYLIRVESAAHKVPRVPLGVCVAGTEGDMGYMIEQSLQNRLHREGIDRQVVTILTQVLVNQNDPAMQNPAKFVGPFLKEKDLPRLREETDWVIKEDPGRGYRRVVPSPIPLAVVESVVIKKLVKDGIIVIACGGGGIPVYYMDGYILEGVDAVIDKDRASAVLATEVGAEIFVMLTGENAVYLNYKTPVQVTLSRFNISQAKEYLVAGHFPAGSMGPKIEAAIQFLEAGGKKVIITSPELVVQALEGKAGSRIIPDGK